MTDLDVVQTTSMGPDTVYGVKDTQTRMASDVADNLIWDRYTLPETRSPALSAALSRITFTRRSTPRPLHVLIELVSGETSAAGHGLVVVVGRSRRLAVDSHAVELRGLMAERGSTAVVGSEVAKTLGEVGAALVAVDTNASLLVMQQAQGTRLCDEKIAV